ncbi:hypothetical protein Pelo_520 [Pelomyxa schiedti]|nr:hypothetical protein Pelo_520 [Pelomyxa schiedti]
MAHRSRPSPHGQHEAVPVVECVFVGDSGCISALFDDLVARGIAASPGQDPRDLTVTLPDQDLLPPLPPQVHQPPPRPTSTPSPSPSPSAVATEAQRHPTTAHHERCHHNGGPTRDAAPGEREREGGAEPHGGGGTGTGTTRRRVRVRLNRVEWKNVLMMRKLWEDMARQNRAPARGKGDRERATAREAATEGGSAEGELDGEGSGAAGVDAVVVVGMARNPDYQIPDSLAHELALLYAKGENVGGLAAAAAVNARNLLLVDCGIGITHSSKVRDAKFAVAFSIGASKLLKGTTKEGHQCTPQGLFRSILETARLPGYGISTHKKKQILPLAFGHENIESFLPPGNALEITEMSPSTVRNKLLRNSHHEPTDGSQANHEPHRATIAVGLALEGWLQVKNWPAITELILGKAMQNEVVSLVGLNMRSVPEQLSGITCQKLDLRHNSITHLPQWLPRAKIQDVVLFDKTKEEPAGWDMHRMLFGELPIAPTSRKLILFGEDNRLKGEVLKCLKDRGHKLKLNSKKKHISSISPYVIQQDFKMHNKEESQTWTVWNLNENCHPFFPCFFCSNSVFLVSFFLKDDPPKRLFFWLDEISRCWSQSNVHGNAQIILIVFTPSKVFTDIQKNFSRTVDLILHSSDRFKSITLRGVYVVSTLKSFEWFSDSTPFSFNESSTNTPATGKQIGRVDQLLERIARETTRPVSPRWIAFSKRLRVVPESIIKWIDFVRLAVSCGVGVPSRCGTKAEVDLEMCCDFLSDTGSIIHFRHPLWSNSSHPNLSQFVLLNPEWFNRLSSDLTQAVSGISADRFHALTGRSPPAQCFDNMADSAKKILWDVQDRTRQPGISSWMSSLLQELHLAFMCDNVLNLSFCLLPGQLGTGFMTLRKLWGPITGNVSGNPPRPSKDKIIVSGRSFRLENVHGSLFTELMNMVAQIGVQPEVFWETALWVSKKCEGVTQDLLLTSEEPGGSLCMFMRTTFSSSDEASGSPAFEANLGAHVLMWLNRFFQVNNLSAVQFFPCPFCLKNALYSENSATLHFFKEGDVLMAALHGKRNLKCPKQEGDEPLVKLIDIAPEFFNLMIGTLPSVSGSFGQTIYEGERALYAAQTVLPVISVLREISKHPRELVSYTGAHLRDEAKLWVISEPLSLSLPPNNLSPEVIAQTFLRNSPLNLRELLMMRPSTEVSLFIGSLLTMSLREKILRDVAKALDCLHSQHPPLVHDGLFLEDGCIWITSLQESGGTTGPWAKFGFFGCLPPREHPETTSHKSNNNSHHHTPHNSFPEPPSATATGTGTPGTGDPKTDVWNFGVLVHQLVHHPANPLVEMQVTAGHRPAGKFHPSHPAVPHPQCETIRVEPQRVGTVAAVKTGCTIVPMFTGDTTTMITPEWAKQVMTSCWTVDPSSRPTMSSLLKLWNHISPSLP